MGATANERQAISKHVNRNDLSFMCIAPDAQHVKIPRYTLTLINFTTEGQVLSTIKMHDKALAEDIKRDLSSDWDLVFITDNYAKPRIFAEQAI